MAYRWEFDGPARLDAASLPEQVRQDLDRFMEAVTIVDPADYGGRRAIPTGQCGPWLSALMARAW